MTLFIDMDMCVVEWVRHPNKLRVLMKLPWVIEVPLVGH